MDFLDSESAQRAMLRLNGKIIPNSQPVGTCNTINLRASKGNESRLGGSVVSMSDS